MTPRPTVGSIAAYFLKLGAVGFGGPAALVERMRVDLVDARGWLSAREFELGLAISASCPGPLAYQLGVYCGFVRQGLAGAFAAGTTFVTAPFILVTLVAMGYGIGSDNAIVRGVFAGAGPAVVVLIGRAIWKLARATLIRAWPAWSLCAGCATLTFWTGQEYLWAFAAAAAIGAWRLRPAGASHLTQSVANPAPRISAMLATSGLANAGAAGVSTTLFAFFFKTGCLIFGSGLAIVPFLRSALVAEHGWLTPTQFLDSVTVGLVSPGPVVITATFVGYLVDGLTGALAATAGMFLPAVLFTVLVTPWFATHQGPTLTGVVRGLTAAVVGTLIGTLPLVALSAVHSAFLLAVGIVVVLLATRRVPDPVLVLVGAAAGAISPLI